MKNYKFQNFIFYPEKEDINLKKEMVRVNSYFWCWRELYENVRN